MSTLQLFFPVRPHKLNQKWGNYDAHYLKYNPTGKHSGIDIGLMNGQEIRAPFDCRVTKIGNNPTGSGIYVCLLSEHEYLIDGNMCRVEVTFMHCKSIITTVGKSLMVGELVALGDNTGDSTGNHTHMSAKRVYLTSYGYEELDPDNGVNGTFDPAPYWNGIYADTAEEIRKVTTKLHEIIGKVVAYLQSKL